MEHQSLFNLEAFNIKLDTEFLGRNFVYCEELDSTNDYLLGNEDFRENGTVVLAEFQTKGKGRHNHDWRSAKGQNLTFSVLLNENLEHFKINYLNLSAALSVGMALENLYQLKPEMKWPNDVLVEGKKIAGILCESLSAGNQITDLVIGIGINVNQTNFPGKYKIPPTSIRIEAKRKVSRERLLSEFLNIFEENIMQLIDSPKNILNNWRERCKMLGDKIWVKVHGSEELFGTFEDINEDGFMLLRVGNEIKKIFSGEIIKK